MDPKQVSYFKRLKRITSSYMSELTNGKVSKKFKSIEFDLVKECFDDANEEEREIGDTHQKKHKEIINENKQEYEEEPEGFEVKKLKERHIRFSIPEGVVSETDSEEEPEVSEATRLNERHIRFSKHMEVASKAETEEEPKVFDVAKLKEKLKRFLKPAETVSQAMRRLRGTVQKKANFKKNVRKGSNQPEKVHEEVNVEFDELCKICSDLIAAECDDLYDWKLEDLFEVRYWKLKGPNGIVGPVTDQQIKIWKDGKKLKGFKIQKTDKQGNSLQGDNWMDFDLFELY